MDLHLPAPAPEQGSAVVKSTDFAANNLDMILNTNFRSLEICLLTYASGSL